MMRVADMDDDIGFGDLFQGGAKRRDQIRHPAARLAMQGPRAFHVVELAPQLGDALADQAAVDFQLTLARPAEKTEAAALAFEMRPGANQPRAPRGERRQLDLQAA